MDYQKLLKSLDTEKNRETYPRNDIGVARLFCTLHKDVLRYAPELKSFLLFNGKHWISDDAGVSSLCTAFVQAYAEYAKKIGGSTLVPTSDGYKDFVSYAAEFHKLGRRKAILEDARSLATKSIVDFDNNPLLLNLQNGTFDLEKTEFREHRADDFITKIAAADYVKGAACERWVKFIDEIMMGDAETALFLQKALGYALSGRTDHDCFFLLYGPSTRNGKSTLLGIVQHLLGDYAILAQPQTIAKRNANGAAPSPDIARLKGARFVNMPEPAKGLELDAALVKQLTGGDAVVARFLMKNPIQFTPEFKIFVGANHTPRITDRSLIESGRMKVIPFRRKFKPEEQEVLKYFFREPGNLSGILNWLLDGYRLFVQDGKLIDPETVKNELETFRQDSTGQMDDFLAANLLKAKSGRVKTHNVHKCHCEWARRNGHKTLSSQAFCGELRFRGFEIKRFSYDGNAIVGYNLKAQDNEKESDVSQNT